MSEQEPKVVSFPANLIRSIPVNLPFERLPQCVHDSGTGQAPTSPCQKCLQESRTRLNDMLIARIRGVPIQKGTPETDADPRNPNIKPYIRPNNT